MWVCFKWNLYRNHCLFSRQEMFYWYLEKTTWNPVRSGWPLIRAGASSEQWKEEVLDAEAGVLLSQTWWNHTHFLLVMGKVSAERDWGMCTQQEWGCGGAVHRSASERERTLRGGVIKYKMANGLIQGRQSFLKRCAVGACWLQQHARKCWSGSTNSGNVFISLCTGKQHLLLEWWHCLRLQPQISDRILSIEQRPLFYSNIESDGFLF